ncbi:hypothetical protein F5144DRAFT_297065 [Chaetomium tenue]|uniref:Uncharacterized protein n=1 Tax=Chaetomium tenue TaxID=1854479 RepID=A0ACB7P4J3_9PEZI|nr:hypothetical protein F5144DRAFT_297065 [Chaetomium globosum]
MSIRDIPPEILNLVLGQLFEYEYDDDPESFIHYGHLRNARLVCRQWHEFATRHLFRTLVLNYAPDQEVRSRQDIPWTHAVNSETIQPVVQDVVIQSHPDALDMDEDPVSDAEDWVTEDIEEDSPFDVAVTSIAQLPNLKSVQIWFPEDCLGARESQWWEDDEKIESISHRLQTLKTVFGAIQKRRANANRTSTIRSLTLKNLQNVTISDFTSSDLYKDVMKDLNELHLFVAHEYNEHGPDHDLDRIERQTFEPYLQNELLPPLAHQLTSLTLTFRECWGVIPAYFDGKVLVFPNLRTLTLGEFVVGHHDQFDWVLAQKSLRTLRLDRCFVVSYLRVLNEQFNEWGVPTHDWHEYPEGSFGFYGSKVFGFSGTWEAVYDGIREGLPNLREFGCVHHRWHNTFDRREEMGADMSASRYIVFDAGLCPSPWISTGEYTGEMNFGNNDPAICPVEEVAQRGRYSLQNPLNRAKETELGDTRAFEDLLRAVRERR